MENDIELPSPPTDGITALKYCHDDDPLASDLLLATSWDASVRLYTTSRSPQCRQQIHLHSPLLDGIFVSYDGVVTGALDGTLTKTCLTSGTSTVLGHHTGSGPTSLSTRDNAVQSLATCHALNLVLSGSWDATVKGWDARQPPADALGTWRVDGKVTSMDLVGMQLLVCTSRETIVRYDVRQMDHPLEVRESPLKYPMRHAALFPNGQGYCLGSLEGRVAVEFLPTPSAPEAPMRHKAYTFKCHRSVVEGRTMVYPVNFLTFHPNGTFVTGGCDGGVNVWDGYCKKRITKLPVYPSSIAALAFNRDGTALAIASSYTFENGVQNDSKNAIFIRSISATDVRPKYQPC